GGAAARSASRASMAGTTRTWALMEVCGGQTHAILRWGLDQLLPAPLRLIHGPGCPVCVTPAETLDAAIALAGQPGVIPAYYGDMLRVPGSNGSSLLSARAAGGDVRVITAAGQALELAQRHPERQVVLLAVGFETTAPATALLARQTLALGLANLSILTAHVRVAPAMEALLAEQPAAPPSPVQGFLAAGHVAAVSGTGALQRLVARRQRPVVVSGFSAEELLRAVLACVGQLEAGEARLTNAYSTVVRPGGNGAARRLLREVFSVVDRPWRGLGVIPGGGLALRGAFQALEARLRFGLPLEPSPRAAIPSPGPCRAGAVLGGRILPSQCPAFASTCTPEHPLGAPMVSGEGACAAYFRCRGGIQRQSRGQHREVGASP
ncbi:MAG: hydrogenase formation protein HypD, partial [Vulcanococcus sp.]